MRKIISLSLLTVRVHVHPCKANFNSQLYSVIFSLEIIFCTIPKAEAVKLGQGLPRPATDGPRTHTPGPRVTGKYAIFARIFSAARH